MTAHRPNEFDVLAGERLLVTGGRNYRDRDFIFRVLDELHSETPIAVLVHGCATGVDSIAAEWAVRRGVALDPYPADWKNIEAPGAVIRFNKHGAYNAAAGKQRNTQMVYEARPSVAVAFPGGTGTDHCCTQIQKQIRRAEADRFSDMTPIRFIDRRNGRTE